MPSLVSGDDSSNGSIPDRIQRAWESDSDSDKESTKDVTELYTYGEMDDEWFDDQVVLQESGSMDDKMIKRRNRTIGNTFCIRKSTASIPRKHGMAEISRYLD